MKLELFVMLSTPCPLTEPYMYPATYADKTKKNFKITTFSLINAILSKRNRTYSVRSLNFSLEPLTRENDTFYLNNSQNFQNFQGLIIVLHDWYHVQR